MPEKVKVLFIGEAVPVGERFFYLAKGSLYKYTKAAFEEAFVEIAFSPDMFRAMGCFLYDVCPGPVYHLTPEQRLAEIQKGIGPLARVVGQLKPDHMIVLSADIREAVVRANGAAGDPVARENIHVLPFPTSLNHETYVRRLSGTLRDIYGIPVCTALFELINLGRIDEISKMLAEDVLYGSEYRSERPRSRGCLRIRGRQKVLDHFCLARHDFMDDEKPCPVDVRLRLDREGRPRLFLHLGEGRAPTHVIRLVETSRGRLSKLFLDQL